MKKKNKNINMSNILGKVGQDNFIVKDTPCLIPKENLNMFKNMQKNASKSSFGNFPNPFNSWH